MKLYKTDVAWFCSNMPDEIDLETGIDILRKLALLAQKKADLYIQGEMLTKERNNLLVEYKIF